jgi:hypothetical protein
MRSIFVFLVVLLAAVLSPTVSAQCKDSVAETSKLVPTTATTDKGEVNQAVLMLRNNPLP